MFELENDEQFKFDLFRTKQIVKKIRKQTFSTLQLKVRFGICKSSQLLPSRTALAKSRYGSSRTP